MGRKMDPREGKGVTDLADSKIRLLLIFGVRCP
jgi:hypothetical protein